MRKILPKILFFGFALLLFSCRETDIGADYVKTYRSDKATVTVSVDRLNQNPAGRFTVTVTSRHNDGLTPRLDWSSRPPLSLTETFEAPEKTVYRFDSALPGSYTLPSLTVTFGEEPPILTDEIKLNIYSETEEGTAPSDIRSLQEDMTDWFRMFLIVACIAVLILTSVLIYLVVRYFGLRRKLKETVERRSLDILESLQTAVANRFETLETDKIAVLILQTMLIRFRDEASMALMLRSFSSETIAKLRSAMEKYQKIAFAREPVGKTELLEDLNFFIGFQKQFENCLRAESRRQ